jgi:hypothetical protein
MHANSEPIGKSRRLMPVLPPDEHADTFRAKTVSRIVA